MDINTIGSSTESFSSEWNEDEVPGGELHSLPLKDLRLTLFMQERAEPGPRKLLAKPILLLAQHTLKGYIFSNVHILDGCYDFSRE